MTTYEALSILVQFSLSLTAGITCIVTIVVFLTNKKK
ncbi:putative holin-like toxin [Paucisalibacillus globulus]|nr:putative holin-like toxin [Paucisalibacillus globulus]